MDEEKKKNNKKQKVSIITVFLWMLLIVTMSVITIGSIYKQNAVEDLVDKVTIKLDMSEIDDEIFDIYIAKILSLAEEPDNTISESDILLICETESGNREEIKFVGKENKIYTYELESIPTENIKLRMSFFDYYENENLLEHEYNEFGVGCYKEIKLEDLKSEYIFKARGEKLEINIKGGYPMFTAIFDQESDSLGAVNMTSFMIGKNYDYENEEYQYIGIRTKESKSIAFMSPQEIYEQDQLLINIEDQTYIKDLTDSNEYYFNMKVEKGTVINLKIEGVGMNTSMDIMDSVAYYVTLVSKSFEEIDLGEVTFMASVYDQQMQIIFPNYLTEDVRYLDLGLEQGWTFYIEKNGELFCYNSIIDLNGAIRANEYNKLNITLKLPKEGGEDTYAIQQIKWSDKDIGKAEIVLGNTSTYIYRIESFYIGNEAIYIQELGDDFVLSSEYENNTRWKIIDSVLDESEILSLFDENIAIKYIYVKDRNTIYWKYNISDIWTQSEPIYVYYKNYSIANDKREILTSHKSSMLYTSGNDSTNMVELKSPNLGFEHLEERNILIQKFDIDGEYYVGVFEDNQLLKIEKLEVRDGNGSVQIGIENYDENKNYTIYEVDENGDKLNNETYSVSFTDHYDMRNAEITSDRTIVSSVKSGMVNAAIGKVTASIEESEGTGENDYVDNMLSVTDIYQAKVTIGEEKEYKVTYETEEGGKLEGETEEYVKDGETPEKVPTPVPDEGYEFDKWVIVENGEEVEVDPNTYVPTKDVTFIAKFKKIDKIVDIDTSDIQVWIYVVVAMVAVIGIVVVVLIVRKNKTRK